MNMFNSNTVFIVIRLSGDCKLYLPIDKRMYTYDEITEIRDEYQFLVDNDLFNEIDYGYYT